jgi:hypothetical protein
MPREKLPEDEKKISVTLSLAPKMLEDLQTLVRDQGISRNAYVTLLLGEEIRKAKRDHRKHLFE